MADIDKARAKIPAHQLGGKHSAAQPNIHFQHERDKRFVSQATLILLRNLMLKAKVSRIEITSTYRSPAHQARVMYQNLKPNKTMYKEHGARVEQVAKTIQFNDRVAPGLAHAISMLPGVEPVGYTTHSKEQIITSMAHEIGRLEEKHGIGCVSRHQCDPSKLNVIDIASESVTPAKALHHFIEVLTASVSVSRIGLPKGSTAKLAKQFVETGACIHLEVPQAYEHRHLDNVV
ncbi:hypothetical protein GON01_02475 [Sphingomonas sp. MAH-20]|uniref:Uncharacterized protein n=1 Tax=Sphingomonas horti TaxID=2682842 RepID=A0A6I4IXJ1_9SPHN|nr:MULTISPECIES: hypothetical protein [Sphingomonas]MBA2920555.1 hypothetical protein [Sphingomonas sp. CGMCC 1.13658]MVO76807.1 hypothetical protein [Sphingomonas horti]